jgi:hypothetical protein
MQYRKTHWVTLSESEESQPCANEILRLRSG